MTWPTTAVTTGDLITAAQLNGLPVRLADSTLGGSAASIDMTSIPSVYNTLLLVIHARSDTAATTTDLLLRVNGDTSTAYQWQRVVAANTTVTADEGISTTSITLGSIPAASAAASYFGVCHVLMAKYATSGTSMKCVTATGFRPITSTSGSLQTFQSGGMLRQTSATSQLTVLPAAGSLLTGTRVTLWGFA